MAKCSCGRDAKSFEACFKHKQNSMAGSTTDLKKGVTINYNNDLYTIVDFQHVKPGKGGAVPRGDREVTLASR